jgi:uncharacterized surface protein with fasciclin (FAS1) repeats
MKRSIIAGFGFALAVSAVTLAPASGSTAGAAGGTIADVLLADKAKDDANGFDTSWRDYDIVTQAVLAFPDLVAAASDPNASLTVLAPTDRAFQRLVKDLTGKKPKTEKEAFDAVVSLGLPTVKAVLTYHIVGQKLDPKAVLSSDNVAVPTLNGGTFTVDVISKRFAFVQFVDGDPNARNAFLSAINVGGVLSNGYIHGVDRVLRPIDL